MERGYLIYGKSKMGYTKKQRIFAEYLLKQVGITNQKFIESYLNHLALLYGNWIQINRWIYSTSECIDLLLSEIYLKKNTDIIIRKSSFNKRIWATDLSNYTYCPASYVLGKSFEIQKPSGIEFTEIGKNLHEKLLLLNRVTQKNIIERKMPLEQGISDNIISSPLLQKIISSRLIFSGHGENKVFVNEQENYSGSPDYIFQDEEGNYFAVEEKFHKIRNPFKQTYKELIEEYDSDASFRREKWSELQIPFYKNHQVQLISYLNNIKQYHLKYGYLIYWFYDFEYREPYVHREAVLEIKLDDQKKAYYSEAKTGIESIIKEKGSSFDIKKLNPKKCAGCVVNKYCAHKSGKFEHLKFPYDPSDLALVKIPFPEELRRLPPPNPVKT